MTAGVGTPDDARAPAGAAALTACRLRVHRALHDTLLLAALVGVVASCLVGETLELDGVVLAEMRGRVDVGLIHGVAAVAAVIAWPGRRLGSLAGVWVRAAAVLWTMCLVNMGSTHGATLRVLWPARVADVAAWILVLSVPATAFVHALLFRWEQHARAAITPVR